MEALILIAHVLLAAGIIALVLLQQGKGAEAGASFGAGASQTVFGSTGNATFMSRMTSVFVTAFFVTSFALAVYAKNKATEVQGLGIPSAEVIEANSQSQLPVLEEAAPAIIDADVPVSE